VTETWNAKILLVREERIFTPPRRSVLPGVTLQVVEELCRAEQLSFAERPWHVVDLPAAEEAILTSTSFSLAPVRQLDEIRLSCPGPVFERLSASWQQAGFPW
jgi:branched-subunit amino acid aminotransferase/4-amino-4-deoxychorismate lyase